MRKHPVAGVGKLARVLDGDGDCLRHYGSVVLAQTAPVLALSNRQKLFGMTENRV